MHSAERPYMCDHPDCDFRLGRFNFQNASSMATANAFSQAVAGCINLPSSDANEKTTYNLTNAPMNPKNTFANFKTAIAEIAASHAATNSSDTTTLTAVKLKRN